MSDAFKPLLTRLADGATLDGDDAEAFVDAYRGLLRDAYPPEPDGTTLFPFKRVFVVGQK